MEFAALEHKKKIYILIMGKNVVSTVAPLFLIGSSIIAGNEDNYKAWMSLNFRGIPPRTAEYAADKSVKNRCITMLPL